MSLGQEGFLLSSLCEAWFLVPERRFFDPKPSLRGDGESVRFGHPGKGRALGDRQGWLVGYRHPEGMIGRADGPLFQPADHFFFLLGSREDTFFPSQ